VNYAPPLSNRQRASEDFRGLSEGMMRALSLIKQTKDEEDQKKRQDLQDQLTQQQIASNAIGLQQKQTEQGLVSQFGDRATRDATPGALGPALPGEENAAPAPFTNKTNSDTFKANIVKQLRVARGQDPGDPLAESQARQAETDKIIGDAKAAPQLRQLNIDKTQADIGHTKAATTLAKAEADKAEAEATAAPFKAKDLPADVRAEVSAISGKNGTKVAIANQIDSYLTQFKSAKTEDDKVRIGRQMLKVLNSPEGADAIGAEESKRLGDALEYNIADVGAGLGIKTGKFHGRDLAGFETQAQATLDAIRGSVNANRQEVDRLLGRSKETGGPSSLDKTDPRVQKALAAGYSEDEIRSYLGGRQ
jgi:hypothetical protein